MAEEIFEPETDAALRRRHALVVLLTVHSGYTDAVGFLALGGAFTSVMTGNLVLFGVSAARSDIALAQHTAAAIACYVAGCLAGAHVAGTTQAGQPIWPRGVSRALAVELAAFAVFAMGWWAKGSDPHGGVQLALLSINALGLGIQSSAVQRFGVSGLSTTYMTGTLTTVVVQLAAGRGLRAVAASVTLLAGLLTGAVVGALATRYLSAAVPGVQLALLLVVVGASRTLVRRTAAVPRPWIGG